MVEHYAEDAVDHYEACINVAVGLGSNLGDRLANLQVGASGIAEIVRDVRYSRVYETQPMYVPGQPSFLNACCIGRTSLPAGVLLQALQDIERGAGRLPGGQRFGPRALDLDLLLYGELDCDGTDLAVPHPRLRERAFVLTPLAEVAPDWKLPALDGCPSSTVGQLAAERGEDGIVLTHLKLSAT